MKKIFTDMKLFNTSFLKTAALVALPMFFVDNAWGQCAGTAIGNFPGTPNNCATRENYTGFAGYPMIDLSKFITGQTLGGTWAFVSSSPAGPTPVGFVPSSGTFTVSNAATLDSYVFRYTEPSCATPIQITVKPAPDLDMPMNTTTSKPCPFDLSTLFGSNAVTMAISISYSPNGNNPIVPATNNYTIKAAKNSGCQSEKFVNLTCTALPIELLSFDAQKEKSKATLQWSTASERNGSHFDVQRSKDGKTFTSIGQVKAVGNSFTLQRYEFNDENPLSGTNYYRLNAVDFDGSAKFSALKSVKLAGINKAMIFPNPTLGDISVELDGDRVKGDVQVEVHNLIGQKVLAKKVGFEGDNFIFTLPTSDLPNGNYVLTLKNGLETLQYKFNKL